jgi:aminoglycoside phosphotransferase (APT) family kinase protein
MPQPRERDLDETGRRLGQWLRSRMSEARALRLVDLRGPSDTGFSSDTLLFDVVFDRDGAERRESLVARLQPTGFCVFPYYDVGLQYRVMRALGRSTDVPVPRMRWLEEDSSLLGTPFYVMDRVEGRVPPDSPPYHTAGWVMELAPEERRALWWSGLDAMARVHCADPFALGLEDLAQPERGATPIAQQLHYYDEFLSWGMDRSRYPLLERALRWLRGSQPKDEPVGLCWGDARLANQIFRGTQCVAVLDWEMATLGNPVADLAWWVTLDRCFYEGIGVPRLSGLPTREETVARWQTRTGREAAQLEYYEVFAAFRFAVIMARVSLQLKHYGVLPPQSDFDVENLASHVLRHLLEAEA